MKDDAKSLIIRVLLQDLPDFYQYILDYPNVKLANVEDTFRWEKVNFGLKPTLRIVHVLTMHDDKADQPAYVIAEKQLYAITLRLLWTLRS